MIYATFFMEQHLGHQTYYQNLRPSIDSSEQISATWVPITYTGLNGICKRFFFSNKLQGSLAGRRQVQYGLQVKPCDVLFFNTQVPAALLGSIPRNSPYIISTDITPIQYDQMAASYGHQPDSKGLLRWYKHRVNTQLFRGAARLLPWSSWAAKSLVDDYGVDPKRIEIMPVGVDLEVWRPGVHSNKKPLRILFVGGDFFRKGGQLLLEAFRSLPVGCAEIILVTRSEVSYEDGINVYRNIEPNSLELRRLYQKSNIFVLPSNAEAFGIAAVEAIASGLPVIATYTGGLSDIIIDQKTGFLIPVGDVQALATRLNLLVENQELRNQMGFAARKRAETFFNAKMNSARVIEIIKELLSKRESR